MNGENVVRLVTPLADGIHPPFKKTYERRVVLPERLVDDFAALTGGANEPEPSRGRWYLVMAVWFAVGVALGSIAALAYTLGVFS